MTNSECLSIFEAYLRNDKKASENTLSSYLRDIRQFSEYLSSRSAIEMTDAGEEELADYIAHLTEQGESVATVSRNIASLKSLSSYLTINRLTRDNPTMARKFEELRKTQDEA